MPFLFLMIVSFAIVTAWCVQGLLAFFSAWFGWGDAGRMTIDARVGAILILSATTALAGLACWYPCYVCAYHAAPDDRYEMVLGMVFPFWLLGPALALRAQFRLVRAVLGQPRRSGNIWFVLGGSLLTLAGISPWLLFLGRSWGR